jgi:hypothetical protein
MECAIALDFDVARPQAGEFPERLDRADKQCRAQRRRTVERPAQGGACKFRPERLASTPLGDASRLNWPAYCSLGLDMALSFDSGEAGGGTERRK